MQTLQFSLICITLATTRLPEMTAFYDKVFDAHMHAKPMLGTTLYTGNIAGIRLLLCPNEIAGVKAEQNRHQLKFKVTDLDALLRQVNAAGGAPVGEIVASAQGKTVAVRDPDGNTIEFIQQASTFDSSISSTERKND
ncbi:MAG: VOC family protein [bacterium]